MPNGTGQQPMQTPGVPPGMTQDTPIAYYTPIAITPGTIKWFMGATVGIIGFLAASPVAERYMMPARDSDLQSVRVLVDTLRAEQQQSRDAISRLTVAVDSLSGLVTRMQVAAGPITKARR